MPHLLRELQSKRIDVSDNDIASSGVFCDSGSHDPNRFFPGMGTLFLRMMCEALGVALRRYATA